MRSHGAAETTKTIMSGVDDRGDVAAPVVAAVDDSTSAEAAVEVAARLAIDLRAPLLYVYVRRGPAGFLGGPVYQRSLSTHVSRGRRVLDRALEQAASLGVEAESMILDGSPVRRILELARDRGAQLLVVGSRRRLLGRSFAHAVVRAADRPVVVAPRARDASRNAGDRPVRGRIQRLRGTTTPSVGSRRLSPVPVRSGRRIGAH